MAVRIHDTHQRKSKVLFYCNTYRESLLLVANCDSILIIFSNVYYTLCYQLRENTWLYAGKARVNYFKSGKTILDDSKSL